MKFTFLYIGLTLSIALLSNIANAALINADLNSTGDNLLVLDTSTTLEWLDLTATGGLSLDNAFDTYSEFRLATVDEVSDLFTKLFPTYSPNTFPLNFYQSSEGVVSTAAAEIDNSLSLIGGWMINVDYQYGLYQDSSDGGIFKLMGSYSNGSDRRIYGMDYADDYTNYTIDPLMNFGYYMVKGDRISAIPEPSILAIFALGMFALASRRFKKKS